MEDAGRRLGATAIPTPNGLGSVNQHRQGSTLVAQHPPTITRSAFIRSERRTRSATGTCFLLPRCWVVTSSAHVRVPERTLCRVPTEVCSMVTMRSRLSISRPTLRNTGLPSIHGARHQDAFLPARYKNDRGDRRAQRTHGTNTGLVERLVAVPSGSIRCWAGRYGHNRQPRLRVVAGGRAQVGPCRSGARPVRISPPGETER
jgi:hypothetical protein